MIGLTVIGAAAPDKVAATLFIDVAIIVAVARLMGALFRRLRQPAVVGEILAGILLGPTLLGALPGNLTIRIFPTEVRPFLGIIAQLGLIIFMFIVGLELDAKLIRGKERVAAVISLSSVVLPFTLGLALAAALHSAHDVVDHRRVGLLPFALFIGASMSVTAFPVLARILSERGMHRTPLGVITLASAAVDDILAWSLLAVVLAVVKSQGPGGGGDPWELPRILLESVLFVVLMFVVVKPRLEGLGRLHRRAGRLTPGVLAVVLIGILVSAFVTSKIGIHSIFGAFLFGVVMPRRDTADLTAGILEQLENVTVLLLLPVFFIATGLDVNVRAIGVSGLGELALILLVACGGKFVGATLAARAQHLPWRQAAAVGTLMNTRGLTELVILNIGFQYKVIDGPLYTLLVVMAVVTTVMTEPVLRLVYPEEWLQRDIAEAEKVALGQPDDYRVLLVLGRRADADHVLDLATALLADTRPSELVLIRFSSLATRLEVGSGLGQELNEMAAVLDELGRLAHRAQARGVRCVTTSQFSADPAADLVARASASDADLILFDRATGDELFGTVGGAAGLVVDGAGRLADAPCDVAVLVDPTGAGVAVGPGRDILVPDADRPGESAALDLAVRLASGTGATVRLVPGPVARGSRATRHLTALAEEVRQVGSACAVARRDGPLPTAGLEIRSGDADDQEAGADESSDSGLPVLVVTARARPEGAGPRPLRERLVGLGAS